MAMLNNSLAKFLKICWLGFVIWDEVAKSHQRNSPKLNVLKSGPKFFTQTYCPMSQTSGCLLLCTAINSVIMMIFQWTKI